MKSFDFSKSQWKSMKSEKYLEKLRTPDLHFCVVSFFLSISSLSKLEVNIRRRFLLFHQKVLKFNSNRESNNIPNRVLLKIELAMDYYIVRWVLRFLIIFVSKSIFIRSQFNLKNEHIMEYPIERKTLKSFYSKSSFGRFGML